MNRPPLERMFPNYVVVEPNTADQARIAELEREVESLQEQLEEERGARLRAERVGKLERRWQP